MPPPNPYGNDLAGREPLETMRDSVGRIRTLVGQWGPAQFERSYAPGKWTARQILIHLAQTEIALGNRARMALSTPGYVAQPFDQDQWIGRDGSLGAREALEAFGAMSAMNRTMFASLSAAERATTLSHPEYGALTVDWIIQQMAGHHIHHLKQLEQIR
jgi:DinB superfamily